MQHEKLSRRSLLLLAATLPACGGPEQESELTIPLLSTGLSVASGTAGARRCFLVLGQSNEGTGGSDVSLMPAGVPVAARAARFFNFNCAGFWVPAVESIAASAGSPFAVFLDVGRIGPLAFFAERVLSDPRLDGVELGVIPCIRGGQTSEDWAWSTALNTLPGASLRRCQTALNRPGTSLAGVIVGQCESNGASAALAARWRSDWENTRDQLRTSLGMASLPFFWMKGYADPPSGFSAVDWATLLAAQEDLVAAQPATNFLMQKKNSPRTDGTHVAVGANNTEGEWGTGWDLGGSYLATL